MTTSSWLGLSLPSIEAAIFSSVSGFMITVSANEKCRYICKGFSHWLKLLSYEWIEYIENRSGLSINTLKNIAACSGSSLISFQKIDSKPFIGHIHQHRFWNVDVPLPQPGKKKMPSIPYSSKDMNSFRFMSCFFSIGSGSVTSPALGQASVSPQCQWRNHDKYGRMNQKNKSNKKYEITTPNPNIKEQCAYFGEYTA